MMSEKSTTVYRFVSRAIRSKKKIWVCTHARDRRWKNGRMTHSKLSLKSLGIALHRYKDSRSLWDNLPEGIELLIIEEGQFFDMDLPLYIEKILNRGISVVVAGLDLTSEGFPFGSMGHILCLADTVVKLTAICPCGKEATRSLHRTGKSGEVEIGGEETYTPACVACWRNKGQNWNERPDRTPV